MEKGFSDRLKTKDSLVGMATMIDSKGNIIFRKHNMIVASGRRLVMRAFVSQLTLNGEAVNSSGGTLGTINFPILHFADDSFASYSEMTKDELGEGLSTAESADNKITSVTPSMISVDYNELTLTLTYSLKLPSSILYYTFSEMYLTYVEGTGTAQQLFSRIYFDKVLASSSEAYTITYVIYF